MVENDLEIYTDGSYLESFKQGAFAVRFIETDFNGDMYSQSHQSSAYQNTNSFQMEIKGIIWALQHIAERDGSYSAQRQRRLRCSLTEVGVRYWDFMPRLFSWDAAVDLRPCPLAATYQLVRNVLAVAVGPDGIIGAGHAVLLYDARNPAFQSGRAGQIVLETTRAALREPERLRRQSWQVILGALREHSVLPWLTDLLAAKYGL